MFRNESNEDKMEQSANFKFPRRPFRFQFNGTEHLIHAYHPVESSKYNTPFLLSLSSHSQDTSCVLVPTAMFLLVQLFTSTRAEDKVKINVDTKLNVDSFTKHPKRIDAAFCPKFVVCGRSFYVIVLLIKPLSKCSFFPKYHKPFIVIRFDTQHIITQTGTFVSALCAFLLV
jgi:hypothetical protein